MPMTGGDATISSQFKGIPILAKVRQDRAVGASVSD